MTEEFEAVRSAFESKHINLSTDWLESCLEWVHEENPNVNLLLTEIIRLVYEQWLLLDLRDIEIPILPQNISNMDKTNLDGYYSLQLMKFVDISQSKLSQLNSIRKKNSDTRIGDKEEIKSGRMLKLFLTDGVQEIEAIEYNPIKCLSDLSPGIKIQIIGPVSVRRGQLLLTDKNIMMCGGSVQDLLIPNQVENILAQYLNLPQVDRPPETRITETIVDNMSDEEEMEMLAAVDLALAESRAVETPKQEPEMLDDSIFTSIDLDAHLDTLDQQIVEITPKPRTSIPISNLLKIRTNLTTGKFRIKAKFKSVARKLTVDGDNWTMKLLVCDESGEIEAYLNSDIISEMIGYCPSAMLSIKQDIVNKDRCAMASVLKAIDEFKKKIVALNGIMELFFKNKETAPEIMQIL